MYFGHSKKLVVADSNMIYDLCIVGAGLWGSAAARHATKHDQDDRKVCLIGPSEPKAEDRPNREIFGSYYDAGRQVRRYQGTHLSRCLISKRTFESLKELEKSTGIKLNDEVSHIMYGHNIEDKMVPLAKQDGVFMDASGLQDSFPFLDIRPYGNSAMLFPSHAGYADPRLIVHAQQRAARLQGCDVIDDVVESVVEGKSGHRHAGDGPLVRLLTKRGRTLLAKRVLLCTGVFTNLKSLLPPGMKLDLKVDGTFTVNLEVGEGDFQKLRTMPTLSSYTDREWNCYMLPPIKYPDGKTYVKIGPGWQDQTRLHSLHEVRDWFLSELDPKLVDKYKKLLLDIVKGFTPLSVRAEKCACSRTPTTLPYCDLVSSRLGIAVGGNGFGSMLCDEMGRMAAEMITGVENWNHDIPRDELRAQFLCPPSEL